MTSQDDAVAFDITWTTSPGCRVQRSSSVTGPSGLNVLGRRPRRLYGEWYAVTADREESKGRARYDGGS